VAAHLTYFFLYQAVADIFFFSDLYIIHIFEVCRVSGGILFVQDTLNRHLEQTNIHPDSFKRWRKTNILQGITIKKARSSILSNTGEKCEVSDEARDGSSNE
jgi:hypothetical protein